MSSRQATDAKWYRQVLGQYPTGVCVVTAVEPDGSRVGFSVGSFTSVSLDPPLVAFFPDKRSGSWARIRECGSFCVNILSADQEDVCRRFASRGDDKFAGAAFRDAGSGAPILNGVVAWIDCDIETISEGGDHHIVVGRVRELEIENPSLPLLFFQGGYGRFTAHSLVAGNPRGALTEQLRQVDLVRTEMEQVAEDIPGARCAAAALVDDELVITASAGEQAARSPATLVGQRMAFMPPIGTAFAAWMEGPALDKWLAHLPDDQTRADQRERLAAVRHRGFSVAPRTEAQREIEATLMRLAVDPLAVDADYLRGHVRKLAAEPVELTPDVRAAIGAVIVPVFGPDCTVAMLFTLNAFAEPTSAEQADAYIERLRLAGQRATALLGGRVPVDS